MDRTVARKGAGRTAAGARLRIGAVVAVVAVLLLGAARVAPEMFLGAVSGVVRDSEGVGIADALVTLEGSSYRTVTIDDGRFVLDSVLEGSYVMQVEREGYRALRAEIRVPKDSAVNVEVTLQTLGQRLGTVRINERMRSRIGGRVVDENDMPVADVSVSLIGNGKRVTTNSDGEFQFLDLPPGAYLVEAIKLGFERSRYPVQMVAGLQRDVAMRLRRGARALTEVDVFNAAMGAREAESRHDLRPRTHTLILTRDQLAKYGRQPLDFVLAQSPLRQRFVEVPVGQYCILIDGIRPMSRGIQSMNEGTTGAPPPPEDGWLGTFFADQLEMVELYPTGTDESRTSCGRFTPGSGCMCMNGQPTPPTVVVWMR